MTALARVRTIDTLFRRLLPLLGPYREHLVIAGGMARDLYRYAPGYRDLGLTGAQTLDLDIALDDPLQVCGESHLHELLINAGLRHVTSDALRERPPFGLILTPVAGRYYPAAIRTPQRTDPHVEFITQLRNTDSTANAHPQRDPLIAYTLDHVDLLLAAPLRIDVPGLGTVRIPHPLGYVLQKTLIRPERQRNRQNFAKDSADAFAVTVSMRAAWETWRPTFQQWLEHHHYQGWMAQARSLWSRLYDRPNDPGAIEVSAAHPRYRPDDVVVIMRELREVLDQPHEQMPPR